jgi:3-oxoacid CoA-transferase B subunit
MSGMIGWDKQSHAREVLALLKPQSYVNLGIGMPGLISSLIGDHDEIYLHCENGITGYRDLREGELPNTHIIDAASKPVGLIPGASVVAHDLSFAIARGGRLDATVLGAYQVDSEGNFANWKTPGSPIAGVGGAMDLAVGAKEVIIMMKHLGKNGERKILHRCSFPLTAHQVVDYIVTEFASMRLVDRKLEILNLAPGVTRESLQEITEPELIFAPATATQKI